MTFLDLRRRRVTPGGHLSMAEIFSNIVFRGGQHIDIEYICFAKIRQDFFPTWKRRRVPPREVISVRLTVQFIVCFLR